MSSEKIRWYDPQTHCEVKEVPNKSKGGTRPPTIRDARKHGFLPSVTSVLGNLGAHGLTYWQIGQAIKAAAENPFTGDANHLESYLSYETMIRQKSEEYTAKCAERGSEIHGHVEDFLEKGKKPLDAVGAKVCRAYEAFLSDVDATDVTCEEPLGGREFGFAGTPDTVCNVSYEHLSGYFNADLGRGRKRLIIDLKTTNLKTYKSPHDKWKLQLGAYSLMAGEAQLVQVVADREDGETKFILHKDPLQWAAGFQHLLELWVIMKGYDPRTVEI